MTNPLVSIIVPVYNTAEYVEECIQSVLSQSYKNIELILVNDGSTDGSGEICKSYTSLLNVHYIEQENLGVTAARKRGVEESHGEWIMFIDSDDIITTDAVNILLNASEGVDIVVGRISNTGSAYPSIMTREEYIFMMFAKKVSSSPWAKLFRKTLFNENTLCFNRKICRWEDWLMNLQIAKDNNTFVKTVSEAVYIYRMRSDSSSHTYVLSFDELENLCSAADEIVFSELEILLYREAKIENRLKLFYHELLLNGFHNEPNHRFVKDVKHCMDEAGVWRPLDRWLLSVSFPWAVKIIWNLRKIVKRLEHPSLIMHDLRRLEIIKKPLRRLYHIYRQIIVMQQYPMLSSFSKREWQSRGGIGIVYMLHHIENPNPQGIPGNQCLKVSSTFLEKIIIEYKKKMFDFISLDELSDILSSGRKPQRPFIAFTIDDGYLDNYTNAFPIFQKHQIPFTIFVATDFIDKKVILWWDVIEDLILSHDEIITSDGVCYPCSTHQQRQNTFNNLRNKILKLNQANLEMELKKLFNRYDINWFSPIKKKGMNWEQIQELSDNPLCTIGGHTISHPAFRMLSEDAIRQEIVNGVEKIEKYTGKKVYHFSYPYGSPTDVGEREYNLAKEFSFKTAFCSRGGCIIQGKSNNMCLPRMPLREELNIN